jgi:lipid-A-disaccharide synthase
VVYKGNAISIGIARMLVNIKYISLVNLVMDSQVVKELIQEDCSGDKISAEIDLMVKDEAYRLSMLENYEKLALKMGSAGASERAAELMMGYLKA